MRRLIITLSASPRTADPPVPLAVPGPITDLVATATGESSIALTWSAPTGTVSGYRIERESPIGGGFSVVVANQATTGFTDTGRSPSTQYNYRVTPLNAAGAGTPDTAFATTSAGSGGGGGAEPITGRVFRTDSLSSSKTATWGVLLPQGTLSDTANLRLYVDDVEVVPAIRVAGGIADALWQDGSYIGVFVQWTQDGDLGGPDPGTGLPIRITTDSARTIGTGSYSDPTINAGTGLPDVYGMMDDPDQVLGANVFPPSVSRADTPSFYSAIGDLSFDRWEALGGLAAGRLGNDPTAQKWDRGLVYFYAWARLPKGHALKRTWFEFMCRCIEDHRGDIHPSYGGNEWTVWQESFPHLYLLTGSPTLHSGIGSGATAFYTKFIQSSGTPYEEIGGRGFSKGILYPLLASKLQSQGAYPNKPTYTPSQHLGHCLNAVDQVLRLQLVTGTGPAGPKYPGPFTCPPAAGSWFTAPQAYPRICQWYMGSMIVDALYQVWRMLDDTEITLPGQSQSTHPSNPNALYPTGRADRRARIVDAIVAHATTLWTHAWNATARMFDYNFNVDNTGWAVGGALGHAGPTYLNAHILGIAYEVTGDPVWRTRGDEVVERMWERIGVGPNTFYVVDGGNYTNDKQVFNYVYSQIPKYLALRL